MTASEHIGDDVDLIVESWRIKRPDFDVSSLAVFSRLYRLARHVDRARKAVFSSHDLESWEFDVLAALRRAPQECLTPGQLVEETLVASGTMTHRIDRLVSRGLVSRKGDDADRRTVLVTLTPDGRALVDASMTDLLATEDNWLESLSHTEREHLVSSLRSLLVGFDDSPRRHGRPRK